MQTTTTKRLARSSLTALLISGCLIGRLEVDNSLEQTGGVPNGGGTDSGSSGAGNAGNAGTAGVGGDSGMPPDGGEGAAEGTAGEGASGNGGQSGSSTGGTAGNAGQSGSGNAGSGGGSAGSGGGNAGSGGGNAGSGGGSAGSGGGSAGSGGMGGAGGKAGAGGLGGGGGGGTAGAGGSGPTSPPCKAVTQLNGTTATLVASNISAFTYATAPTNVTKMAYDPQRQLLVLLTQNGKFHNLDPNVALPATATTLPLTATTLSDEAYAFSGDHRGLVFGPNGTMYVMSATTGNITVTIRKGVGAGPTRVWSSLVTSDAYSGSATNFDHNYSGIALSPDGTSLYFSSGSRSDHGEVQGAAREHPITSAVFKVPTVAPTALVNSEQGLLPYLFADGTRNAFDMAFNAAGDLIATDNGPDMDLPDEINFLQQGKHYGFPWRFGAVDNPVLDPAYVPTGDQRLHAGYEAVSKGLYAYDATFPSAQGITFVDPITNLGPDANYERVDRNATTATKAGAGGLRGITAHRAPLGLTFDTAGALCGEYYEQGFVLGYGGVQDVMGDPGRDLSLITLHKQGAAYTMNVKILANGLRGPIDAVLIGNRLFTTGYVGSNQVLVFVLPQPQ